MRKPTFEDNMGKHRVESSKQAENEKLDREKSQEAADYANDKNICVL